eukprot:670741-Pyramimonas_sp.AAC.1
MALPHAQPPPLEGVRAAWRRVGQIAWFDFPGQWQAGSIGGLDLPDWPGSRWERCRQRSQLLRRLDPRVPAQFQQEEGPRPWWAPGWLDLPLPEEAPHDAWYFRGRPERGVPPS